MKFVFLIILWLMFWGVINTKADINFKNWQFWVLIIIVIALGEVNK